MSAYTALRIVLAINVVALPWSLILSGHAG
jgi:hypothetical protein